MKVSELIEALWKCDPNKEVWIQGNKLEGVHRQFKFDFDWNGAGVDQEVICGDDPRETADDPRSEFSGFKGDVEEVVGLEAF